MREAAALRGEEGPRERSFLQRVLWPEEGWLTFVLLLGPLLVLVWTVEAARWVKTPSLFALAVGGAVWGFLLAKVRVRAVYLHLLGLLLGTAVVYWQTAMVQEGPSLYYKAGVMNYRLALWFTAAVQGGVSTDTLPFALFLAGLAWLIGYLSAWVAFRYRNLWGALLPSTIAFTTNLSYLPDTFLAYIPFYVLAGALLAVRMHTVEQEFRWRREGKGYSPLFRWLSLTDAVWLSGLIVLVAVSLPLRAPMILQMREIWERVRWPVEQLEEEMNRLLSGLPSRRPLPFRAFATHLPFQGPIVLGDHPVFWVKSPVPAYWRVRTYSLYTSHGWLAEPVEVQPLPQEPPAEGFEDFPSPEDLRGRVRLTYTITVRFSTSALPVAAYPIAVDRPVEAQVLPPKTFSLPMRGFSPPGLPEDLALALRFLRRSLSPNLPPSILAARLQWLLPPDTLVTHLLFRKGDQVVKVSVEEQEGEDYPTRLLRAAVQGVGLPLAEVQVTRRPPPQADVVALRSPRRVPAGSSYTVVSSISVASEEELRRAGTAYPAWVRDRYLQLPPTLPARVFRLARALTRDAPTPYDKAVAIQNYLRTFTYDTNIPAPPYNADGVDYFLFELRRGYSEYFGSAMAVLLRAVGIPSRLVVGYGPGEWDEGEQAFVIRDRDSHAWAEAYFPGYGWVEFEPTPGRPVPARGVPPEGRGTFLEIVEEEPSLADFLFAEEEGLDSGAEGQGEGPREALVRAGWGSLGFLLGLLSVAVVLAALYRRAFVRPPSPEAVYERLCRLASWAGMGPYPSQTPFEYACSLARRFPSLKEEMVRIAEAFARVRYGRKRLNPEESRQVWTAWERIRPLLFRAVVARLTRRGGRPPSSTTPSPPSWDG